MAAVVIDLVSYYAAYVLALCIALVIVWVHGDLTPLMAVPAGIFAPLATAVPMALLWVSRGRTLPSWLEGLLSSGQHFERLLRRRQPLLTMSRSSRGVRASNSRSRARCGDTLDHAEGPRS